MITLVGADHPVYHEKYLKEPLKKYDGETRFVPNEEPQKNVCFGNCTTSIRREYHDMQTGNEEEKKSAIIKTAASLIINEIKCLNLIKTKFPSIQEMTSPYELPESLELLLTRLNATFIC